MFELTKKLSNGVRVGLLETPHGVIDTPFFMPVGTAGSVKATSPAELESLGAEIILCNTYHLYLRPGKKLISKLGGLHKFIGWNKPILTDSGGYQVFSLGKNNQNCHSERSEESLRSFANAQDDNRKSLVKVTEEGVEFTSHLDGSKHFFTPEKVIDIQLDLGVDVIMPLDVCPSGKASREEVEKATELTIKWARRAKKHFDRKMQKQSSMGNGNEARIGKSLSSDVTEQRNGPRNRQTNNGRPLLHGIVQGGLYEDLRRHCAAELIKLDFDGYSVGGLAVDHETRDMWKIVKLMGEILPENKQRYLMGVGTPDDIIKATKLGMDMFDCVLPTRLARHGSVYIQVEGRKWKVESGKSHSHKLPTTNYKLLNLLNSRFREDGGVIDKNCGCYACRAGSGFGRAYLSHLIRSDEILGIRLATLHNLSQYLNLMRKLRTD